MDLKKIISWLNNPVPNISITLFRTIFSFILLIQTYYFISNGFIKENIIEPFMLFPFISGLNPMAEIYLVVLSYIMLVANIGMLFNKTAKISTLFFVCSFTYFWLLDKTYFNNHYYFMSLICFILLVVEHKSSFQKINYVSRWSLFALQAMVVITYLIAGINKLNPYWLIDLQPITFILENKCDVTENTFFINPLLVLLITYAGLLFDLLIGFLLFYKRTKLLAFILVIGFNIMNYLLFLDNSEIGVFPFIMISTLILFINPEYLTKVFNVTEGGSHKRESHQLIKYFIAAFLLLQIILPFRHLIFKGYVDYNGIGQRFSWRMKSMCKTPTTEGIIQFSVIDKKSKTQIAYFHLLNMEKQFKKSGIHENLYLTKNQIIKLLYYPDLLPVFTKKIESIISNHTSKTYNVNLNFIITANCHIKFMERTSQPLINTSIDLTEASGFNSNKWLNNLEQKPWRFHQ